MHFWIDKRSQSCGFGRARVAASLSGSGIGFGHHPRRMGGKSMLPPIHRYPPVEYRSHRSTHSGSSSGANSTASSHSNLHQHPHPHHLQQHQQHPATGSASHHQNLIGGRTAAASAQSQVVGGSDTQRLQQFRNILFQRPPAVASSSTVGSGTIGPALAQSGLSQGQQQQQHQQHRQHHQHPGPYRTESPITIQHFGPHSIDLEQGSLGVGTVPPTIATSTAASEGPATRPTAHDPERVALAAAAAAAATAVNVDAQMLPSHLKCGMWASLALTTVFVAGAKLMLTHLVLQQGTGLEVVIFGALTMLFVIGACTVSLCRRTPRDIMLLAVATNATTTTATSSQADEAVALHGLGPTGSGPTGQGQEFVEGGGHQHQRQLLAQQQQQQQQHTVQVTQEPSANSLAVAAPPPPYHIAILLPDAAISDVGDMAKADDDDDDDQLDESPPPSYDKLMV